MKKLFLVACLAVPGCSSDSTREEERIATVYDRIEILRATFESAYAKRNALTLDATQRELEQHAIRNIEFFMKDLKDADLRRKELAAFALAFSKSARARTALLEGTKDPDFIVRAASIASLGMLHLPDTSLEPFREMMKAQEWHVRQGALYGLRFQLNDGQDGGMLPDVIRMLDDSSWEVRTEAVIVLKRIHSSAALPAVVKALHDIDGHVRAIAAATMSVFGQEAAEYTTELIETLKDPETKVVEAAAYALNRIHGRDFDRRYITWRVWYEEEEKRVEYVCPDHPDQLKSAPGQCSKCPKKLVRQPKPDQFACADHPEVMQIRPGKCSKCQKDLLPVKKEK